MISDGKGEDSSEGSLSWRTLIAVCIVSQTEEIRGYVTYFCRASGCVHQVVDHHCRLQAHSDARRLWIGDSWRRSKYCSMSCVRHERERMIWRANAKEL